MASLATVVLTGICILLVVKKPTPEQLIVVLKQPPTVREPGVEKAPEQVPWPRIRPKRKRHKPTQRRIIRYPLDIRPWPQRGL